MNGDLLTSTKIVVADTGPLNALAQIDCFDFLRALFGEIVIADAVYLEATRLEHLPVTRAVRNATWVKHVAAQDLVAIEMLRNELDEGESETIVLARELNASQVLIDERLARRKTAQMGLATLGTLGILLLAKSVGLTPQVKPHLDALRASTFRMSPRLYNDILHRASE